ncbi:MAG: glycerol-3-phosphate acyltransferase [Planctomycetota bacterium]|jgi:glycerol-3-phosphate acyltransferase PlsY
MLSATDLYQIELRAIAAFLIGAIPFAWLIVRVCKGIDVRTLGSGNVGATNASRAFEGKGARIGAFLAVYLLDAGKGALAAWMGFATGLLPGVLCGAAGILGHVFTPFLGGRGGKGVATATGALVVLDWRVTLIALGVFFVVRFATGQVFFGSLALGLGLASSAILLDVPQAFDQRLPLTLLTLVLAAFLFWTHRSNLQTFFAAKQS